MGIVKILPTMFWICPQCEATNAAGRTTCAQCGGPASMAATVNQRPPKGKAGAAQRQAANMESAAEFRRMIRERQRTEGRISESLMNKGGE